MEEHRGDLTDSGCGDGLKLRSRQRRHLDITRRRSAAIWYDRLQRKWRTAEESLARSRGDRYVLKEFYGLDQRPIKFVQPVIGLWVCSMCDKAPQFPQFLPCGHVLCRSCLEKAAQWIVSTQWIVSFGGDCGGYYGACPREGMRFKLNEVRSECIPLRSVLNMPAHCFNVEYGCQFQGRLEQVETHFYRACRFHPDRMPRDDTAMNCVMDCQSGRGDASGGSVRCVPYKAAGRSAACGSASGKKTDGMEDIVRQLNELKTDTSERAGNGNYLLDAYELADARCSELPATSAVSEENASGDDASTDSNAECVIDDESCTEFMLMNVPKSFLYEVD